MIKEEPSINNCDAKVNAATAEIQSDIAAIADNPLLYDEKNVEDRIEAIDFIEFQVLDHIESILQKTTKPEELQLLRRQAEKVKSELEDIDVNLFKKLRDIIRTGGYIGKEFRNLVNEYVDLDHNAHQEEAGYDGLDVFINGLFPVRAMPEQTKDLEPEMVFYQKTPARIVFELVEKVHFGQEDVFFDQGSGLGQVAILVNLLAGIKVIGVEFEPAFCEYASDCAAELNLPDVTFINVDARKADYSEGTIFFMYTPFRGEMLQEVLDILKKESLSRKIKIITYGSCAVQIAAQSWLNFETPYGDNIYKLNVFTSF